MEVFYSDETPQISSILASCNDTTGVRCIILCSWSVPVHYEVAGVIVACSAVECSISQSTLHCSSDVLTVVPTTSRTTSTPRSPV